MTILYVGVPALFTVVGVVVLTYARRNARALRDLRRRGLPARATVDRLVTYTPRSSPFVSDGGDRAPAYTVVVSFTTADGRLISGAKAMYGAGKAAARPGQPVDIIYDPIEPTRLTVARGSSSGQGFVAGMSCLGAGLIGMGLPTTLLMLLIALTIGFPG